MARRLKDIEVWQLSRALVKDVYILASLEKIRKNYCIVDQMQRAALSVMNNVSEGFEWQSNKEFIYFLKIAKGSVGEVRSMLYVLTDLNMMDVSEFQKFQDQTLTIRN